MSLFRTLQHSPSTITIFHNANVPALAALYRQLEQAYQTYGDSKDLFTVDLMANQMPTYDQFVTIAQTCLKDDASKMVLRNCFPFMYDQRVLHQHEPRSVTTKLPVGTDVEESKEKQVGIRMFSEQEYAVIHEAFTKAIDNKDVAEADIFCAPLVVDWDQLVIAGDDDGLRAVLKRYES